MNFIRRKKTILTQMVIFIITVIFFSKIFPLIPYDGDDWYFQGSMRNPWPMWGVFNPSKVLPEVLEPLSGYFGAFVIYPITHNYIASLSISSILIVSISITSIMALTYKYFRKQFKINVTIALLLELFFYLSFFLIFKKSNTPSYFGFWCQDLNCYFNYLIPGCLNAGLLLFFETTAIDSYNLNGYNNYLAVGTLIVAIYLAMFSSIQLNIIFASYSIMRIITSIKGFRKIKLVNYLSSNWPFLMSILFWALSLLFDSHGGRASSVSASSQLNIIKSIKEVFIQYRILVGLTNKIFFFMCIMLICFGLFVSIKMKEKKFINYSFIITICTAIISICFFTLLYTKAPVTYASRPDAMWGIVFLGLLLATEGLALLINKMNYLIILMPFILFIMSTVSFNLNYGYVYKDNSDAFTSYKYDNYIVNRIISAEHQGKTTVKVKVPKGVNVDNWPHPLNQAQWMQNTLYAHGLIRHRIKVIFVSDEKQNKIMYPQGKSQSFSNLEVHK